MALLPFPTCKDFSVITLLDSRPEQFEDIHPSLPLLNVSKGAGDAPVSHRESGEPPAAACVLYCGFL